MTSDEPTDEPTDEPEDEDGVEGEGPRLSAEDRARLAASMEALRQSMSPRLNFRIDGLSQIARESARVSRIAAEAMERLQEPMRQAQQAWAQQFRIVDSDLLRAASQAQFAEISKQLNRNINLGLSDTIAQAAKQWSEQQANWLKSIEPTLLRLKSSFYPPNLRAIEDLDFEEVETVVMTDGIALYGVPGTSVAAALMRADGAANRRAILGRRWRAISRDCRVALESFTSEPVAPYREFGIAAVDALDAGHEAAAQALAGSLIDSLLTAYFGTDRYKYTPDKKGKRTKDAYDDFTLRAFMAFAPMWQAYQQFWATEGDVVPHTFNRNATAHAVSKRQFNRRNAVQSVLFACSLLYYFEERAQQIARR